MSMPQAMQVVVHLFCTAPFGFGKKCDKEELSAGAEFAAFTQRG
jgi:hypothetical protein